MLVASIAAPAREWRRLRSWTLKDFQRISVSWSLVKLLESPDHQSVYEGVSCVPAREERTDSEWDFEGEVGRPFNGSREWFEEEEKKRLDNARIARKQREEEEEHGGSINLSHDPDS